MKKRKWQFKVIVLRYQDSFHSKELTRRIEKYIYISSFRYAYKVYEDALCKYTTFRQTTKIYLVDHKRTIQEYDSRKKSTK